ncbi:diguanylate cyclase [Natronospirillum operosum]|uniref:diguanylate cyclase n=1 Tax=Natronospirillum operosum TaxID=2759953 RepID=A0A4Z0WD28_9GAMM|nr:sensor domain-containing diguanylate cyclase [Natronospirillum operosum]TGG95774.1 diguanylate cyclase [Natronospirillum operosum]
MNGQYATQLLQQFPDVTADRLMDLFGAVWAYFPESMFMVREEVEGEFRVIALNPAQARIFERTVADMKGEWLSNLLPADTYAVIRKHYQQCLAAREPVRYEEQVDYEDAAGERQSGVWSTLLVPLRDQEGRFSILFGISQNITNLYEAQWALERQNQELERRVAARTEELEATNRRLAEAATQDPLTLVYNRRKLNELGQAEFERARRHQTALSVIMLDVDEFKAFNENHGHHFGDQVLVGLIKDLRSVLRKSDILARFGGDEFVALLPHTTETNAYTVAEKMRAAVEQAGQCSISLGLTELRVNDASMAVALERADGALRAAKQQGRNCLLIAT